MKIEIFGDKKIIIKKIRIADKKIAKKFLDFVNSLIAEDAKILMNKKQTLKDEFIYVGNLLKGIKDEKRVYIIAEHNGKIVGNTSIELNTYRRSHIGKFAIAISQQYRGIGLGKYMMAEIMELAEKELTPKPKIIQLEVYANNKPAMVLYKKMGFKIVSKVPKQIQYKGKLIDEFIMQKFL